MLPLSSHYKKVGNMADLQLKLELDIKHDASLSDFSGPSWVSVIDAVRQLHIGLIQQLYLFGEQGTGKTHLLSAICESFIDRNRSAITLSLSELLHTNVAVLSSLETFDVIAIDDVQAIEHFPEWQEGLFHLINRSKEQNKQLIFASSKPVNSMNFALFDLTTRLSQATAFKIPDGHILADREAMLQSILRRRGWQFDSRITQYLLQEGPHHIADMIQVLQHIQPMFASLSRKRVSKATVAEAIKTIDEQTLLAELENIQELSQLQADTDAQEQSARYL